MDDKKKTSRPFAFYAVSLVAEAGSAPTRRYERVVDKDQRVLTEATAS